MKEGKDLESLFGVVCHEYLSAHDCFATRGELGVFSHAAVVWLGVQQRLTNNSLQTSLGKLVERLHADTPLMMLTTRPGRKLRAGEVSLNTGGVSRARDRLPEELVARLFDAATSNIEERLDDARDVYLLDGQVITISRTDSTIGAFGRTGNGEGELHFPRMRVVSAHSLTTGVAKGVAIGTWHDSEVTLAAQILPSLPRGATLVTVQLATFCLERGRSEKRQSSL